MTLCAKPAFVVWELHIHMIVKPRFWMRFLWYCPLDIYRTIFSGIKYFQHHFYKYFSIATLFLVILAVSDHIHITNTALVQRVSVLKITLINIFCSHIFNLCQVVFIDSLLHKKKCSRFKQQVLSNGFLFSYQKIPMKDSHRITCFWVQCVNLIPTESKYFSVIFNCIFFTPCFILYMKFVFRRFAFSKILHSPFITHCQTQVTLSIQV